MKNVPQSWFDVSSVPSRRGPAHPMPRPPDPLPSPPPSLGPEQAAELSALTGQALRHQRRELARAIDLAFDHIPAPLRGAVHRALGV